MVAACGESKLRNVLRVKQFSSQAQNYQAFMLKEYAEQLWRLRHADSSFAGYLPFGQYTWFKKPFDKGPDGLQPKMIWDTYRKVMGTVHIQFECWSRNLFRGGSLEGEFHLFHEDVHLPEDAVFKVEISQGNHKLYSGDHKLKYHCRIDFPLTLGEFAKTGGNTIDLKAYCEGKVVAHNDFSFKVYETHPVPEPTQNIFAYDPAGMLVNALEQFGVKVNMIKHIEAILAESPETSRLLVGPYSMDKDTPQAGADVHAWIKRGSRIVVLEQTPGPFADDIFNSGIGFTKVNQPYWSRWGTNLVKHTDRADMVMPGHTVFNGLSEHDLCW